MKFNMKYLKTLNELFKSTYQSAADKIGAHHPKRKEELMKHASEVGIDTPTTKPRLWPFRFVLDNKLQGEFYSIIDVEYSVSVSGERCEFYIQMESNYRNTRKILLVFYKKFPVLRYDRLFLFNNPDPKIARENAYQLRKFFLDFLEGNVDLDPPSILSGYDLDSIDGFTVNNLYTS